MHRVTCQCGEVYDGRIRLVSGPDLCGVCGSQLPSAGTLKMHPANHLATCIDIPPIEEPYHRPIAVAIAILFIGVLAIGLRILVN